MAITLRSVKGSPLTWDEGDDNFREVQTLMDKAVISPSDYGAVGNGVADDTIALQAAIDAAEAVGGVVDGRNFQYAISRQLTIGGALSIVFQNFNLIALAGTWPTGQSGAMIDVSRATTYERYGTVKLYNVSCNANEQAKSCFYFEQIGANVVVSDCQAMFFSEKGFWVTGSGSTNLKLVNCTSSSRIWTADPTDPFNDYANRTGYSFYIYDASDIVLVNCVGHSSITQLYMDGGIYNATLIGCKFWNGPAQDSETSVVVELVDANSVQFIGCRFDDGAVKLKAFGNMFTGCRFIQYAYGYLILEATSADETADNLQITGCHFAGGNNVVLTTSGSGSWSSTLNVFFVNNMRDNGAPATIDAWEFIDGKLKYKTGNLYFGDGVGNEAVYINGAAGSTRYFGAQSAGENRWTWGANATAEAGSNVGSNWSLNASDDDGIYASTPLIIYRATGNATFGANITLKPPSTAQSLDVNGQITFELTNNTTLTFKARGSDGNTRSGTVTLS